MLLNLATETTLIIAFIFDYINGYMDNDTNMFGGKMQGNNLCFIVFYSMRCLGYVATNYIIDTIQEDVQSIHTGRNGSEDLRLIPSNKFDFHGHLNSHPRHKQHFPVRPFLFGHPRLRDW